MKNFVLSSIKWFSVFAFSLFLTSAIPAQNRPLLQDIVIKNGPSPAATPLVKKTGSSTAVVDDVAPAVPSARAVKTSIPVLADIEIPGYTGILVESMDGNVVVETGSDMLYNPASNVKIATAYAVIKTLGQNYLFPT